MTALPAVDAEQVAACWGRSLAAEGLDPTTPLPFVGMPSAGTDGRGRARAVPRTTDVRVGPLGSVDGSTSWTRARPAAAGRW